MLAGGALLPLGSDRERGGHKRENRSGQAPVTAHAALTGFRGKPPKAMSVSGKPRISQRSTLSISLQFGLPPNLQHLGAGAGWSIWIQVTGRPISFPPHCGESRELLPRKPWAHEQSINPGNFHSPVVRLCSGPFTKNGISASFNRVSAKAIATGSAMLVLIRTSRFCASVLSFI
jgi:hypothetical protein